MSDPSPTAVPTPAPTAVPIPASVSPRAVFSISRPPTPVGSAGSGVVAHADPVADGHAAIEAQLLAAHRSGTRARCSRPLSRQPRSWRLGVQPLADATGSSRSLTWGHLAQPWGSSRCSAAPAGRRVSVGFLAGRPCVILTSRVGRPLHSLSPSSAALSRD